MCRDLTYTTKNDEYINRDLTSMRWLNVIVCGVARIQLRSWVLISSLHTMVDLYPERQCCRSSIEHISKRFFVLRRILDTRRKNVHIVNDSTVRQCHMDHRRSWVKRQSWGWRASTRRILNDGCPPAYQMDVEMSYIVIEMCHDLTYTTEKRRQYRRCCGGESTWFLSP